MCPRPLSGDTDGLSGRPHRAMLAALVVGIRIRIARPLILAVRIGVEKRTVARLGDHLLRQYRCRDRGRQDRHRAQNLESRHSVSPRWGEQGITPKRVRSSLLHDQPTVKATASFIEAVSA